MNRDFALEIARAHAKAAYGAAYTEGFVPHDWVIDAMLAAARVQLARDMDILQDLLLAFDNDVATAAQLRKVYADVIVRANDAIAKARGTWTP